QVRWLECHGTRAGASPHATALGPALASAEDESRRQRSFTGAATERRTMSTTALPLMRPSSFLAVLIVFSLAACGGAPPPPSQPDVEEPDVTVPPEVVVEEVPETERRVEI